MTDQSTAVGAAVKTDPTVWQPFKPGDLQKWHEGVSVKRHKVTKFAKIVLLVMFGLGSIWASTVEIGGAVVAPGTVITEARNRVIQNLEGGILYALPVREGETVNKGDVVAQLDTTASDGQLQALEVREAIFRIQLARRQATIADLDEIELPTDLPARVMASPRVQETIAAQRSEFQSSNDFIKGEIKALEIQIDNLYKDNQGLSQVLSSLQKQEAQTREFAMGLKELLEKDGTVSVQVVNRELGLLYGLEAQIEETKVQMQQNLGGIEDAENRKQQVRLQLLQRSEIQTVNLQAQLNDTSEQIARLRDRIERASMRSPVDGTVIQIHQKTLGAVLKPAETILEIFPIEDQLQIEVRIKPKDVKDTRLGQSAKIQFGRIFSSSPISGTLTFISDDVVPDPEDRNADPTYTALVRVDPDADTDDVIPGNTAQVYLETEPRTFFEIITGPFSRLEFEAFKN